MCRKETKSGGGHLRKQEQCCWRYRQRGCWEAMLDRFIQRGERRQQSAEGRSTQTEEMRKWKRKKKRSERGGEGRDEADAQAMQDA